MRTYTTDALIESIKRRGAIPLNQATYTADRALAMADDELQTMIAPLILKLKADHFLTYSDQTTTTSVVYDIPASAHNRSLHAVVYVASDGSETRLTKIDFDVETSFNADGEFFPGGAYYLRGDKVVLYPDSTAGRTLRMYFYRLPNQLVATTDAAEVLSVDTVTDIITCSSVPAAWVVGDSICCVAGTPGFDLRFEAKTIVAVSSPTVTVDDASSVVAGDWLAMEGDSPIPQIPVEVHPILAQATVVKILEGLGDPKTERSEKKLQQIMEMYTGVGTPRVATALPTLKSRNRLIDHI